MNKEIPVRKVLNNNEAQALLAADEELITQMMQITVELNVLAERAGKLTKAYIEKYQRITAPARLRPMQKPPEVSYD